jgi:nucleotide-binding universal stress UspA family protein
MSIFPTKILLATDGSKDVELARTTAVDLATTTDSELHIVTVASGYSPYGGYPSHDLRIPEVVEQLRKRAQIILDEQVQKIERDGGSVAQKHLKIAEPVGGRKRAQQILQVAEEIEAGLIVVGTRGHGGLRRALMGSVSDSVVRHAHCLVLVVRHERQSGGAGSAISEKPLMAKFAEFTFHALG